LNGRVSGTNDNILTAAALDETTVNNARVAMANFKGEDGRPLGTKLTHLVVPPALELAALKVVQAEYLASGATNVMNKAAQIIVLPQLSDTTNDAAALTTWYAMDLSRVIKPLISQVREAPDFVSRTDPASDPKFNRDEYEFGSQARGAAGYGLYFTAIRNSTAGT
jgi:phage major head subunit gpT-like protein